MSDENEESDGVDIGGDEHDGSAGPMPMRDAALRDLLASGFAHDTKIQPQAVGLSSILVRAFVE